MDPPSILHDNRIPLNQLSRSRAPIAKSVKSPTKAKTNIAHLRIANQSRDDEPKQGGIRIARPIRGPHPERAIPLPLLGPGRFQEPVQLGPDLRLGRTDLLCGEPQGALAVQGTDLFAVDDVADDDLHQPGEMTEDRFSHRVVVLHPSFEALFEVNSC